MRQSRRSGFVIAMALICLTVALLILIVVVQRVLISHQQILRQQKQMQSQQIAESAVSLARVKLKSDPEYMGEQWKIPAGELTGVAAGLADINVEKNGDKSIVQVLAIYPDHELGVRTEKRVLLEAEAQANE